MTAVSPTVADLAASVAGAVHLPGDPGYGPATAGFNVAHRPAPAVVVEATSESDVVAAVRFAAATGRAVATQATGHGLRGDLEGTVLVTTARMSSVRVDVARRTAVVTAGARWRDVIDAAAPHGLAPITGSASSVGVIGMALGGGVGPFSRAFGMAADRIVRLRLVTADGSVRELTAERDPELFWAVRGARGAFGIVTEIELELVRIVRFHGGGIFFPAGSAATVLHAWREWAPSLPEQASTSIALLALPPDPALPEPLRGQYVAHVRFAHLGSAEEGDALLSPIRAAATPLVDTVAELPFAAIDAVHMDPATPLPVYELGCSVRALPAEAVDAVLALAGPDAGSPLMMVEFRLLGGAIARRPAHAPSAPGREGAFTVHALGIPTDPQQAAAVRERTAAVVAAVEPWSARGMLNFIGSAGLERFGALWEPAEWARLRAIKAKVDPAGVFTTDQIPDLG
jgi:FAD/FMN-containing dehydrogenase